MNKTVLTSFTILCLLSTVFLMGLSFNIQPVKASGTIYIRADGNVEGTTNIVTADNVTYTLNATINDSIVVERSNIIIDGAGHTVNGLGTGPGFKLTNINNATIKNTQIKQFNQGVYLSHSFNNTVSGNVFVGDGLYVWDSFGSVVVDNLVNGKPLVYFEGVSDVVVEDAGQVILVNCNRIKVENLNLSHTSVGVELWRTNSTTLTGNNITNNLYGVYLRDSSGNMVSGNNITNNDCGVSVLVPSGNNTVSGNNITNNDYYGVYFSYSSGNMVSGNNIINNDHGVYFVYSSGKYLECSSGNMVSGNNITNNNVGVYLDDSSDNRFYHNNLINNTDQVYSESSVNIWDDGYPSGGNYWSDYSTIDLYSGPYQNETGYDWIGDSPYVIDENNQDKYPLMHPFVPEMEEIRIAYRNLLLRLRGLNSTLHKLLGNITDLKEKYDSLLTTINDMQEQIYSLGYSFQMSIFDLLEQVYSLNSTLLTSVSELQELYNSLNSTLTSKQEAIIDELANIRNVMYVLVATTVMLIATTVYLAIRKPKTKP